ncbi:thermonuclease family protein [Novispirillum sp. DQ9]|uniref:thermonuclease family protein n=1 Tax=Novispirillum sp. DQ9 TaxID=3398612 RepID=UPI003C7BE718
MRRMLMIAALAVLAGPAVAADLEGQASVIDGDTVEIAGQRVRLHGVDTPESRQLCYRDGQPWHCGRDAALALADKVGRRHVRCEPKDKDGYGRVVAVCYLGDADLNAWLVGQGWGMAYVKYSRAYAANELLAKEARRGIWASEFDPPWDWRRGKREAGSAAPPTGHVDAAATACPIKGNVNAKGQRIYHVPGGQFYDRTRINEVEGDRWFCSEGEAQGAGFRRSQR